MALARYLLLTTLLFASSAITLGTPSNRDVRINVLQFLHRDTLSTVVDANLLREEIKRILLTCGFTCRFESPRIRHGEVIDQDFVRTMKPFPPDHDYDELTVWGWVEHFDIDRVRMILFLNTRDSGAYAFFHDAEIQWGRIIGWDGQRCDLDVKALAIPAAALAAAAITQGRFERDTLKHLVATNTHILKPISVDNEIGYAFAPGSRPTETSKKVRLALDNTGRDSIILPVPALWHLNLRRFVDRESIASFRVPRSEDVPQPIIDWKSTIAGGATCLGSLVGLTQSTQGSGNVFLLNNDPSAFHGYGSGFRLETAAGRLQVLLMLSSLLGSAALASDWPQVGAGYTQVGIDVPARLTVGSIADRSYVFEKAELQSQPHYELRFPISENISTRMSVQTLKQTYVQHCEIHSAGQVCNDTASLSVGLFTLKSTINYSTPIMSSSLKVNAGFGFESVHVKLWNDHPLFVSPDPNDQRILETSMSNLKISALLTLGCEYVIADLVSVCVDAGLRFPEKYTFGDGFWIRRGLGHVAITALIDFGKAK